MTAPWTERERALRAALEFALKVSEMVRNGTAHELPFTPDEFLSKLRSALADQPPPDPRDEALRLAEAELLRLWKLVPAGRAGVGGVRTIALEDDEVARLRQIVDAIRAATETGANR